MPTDTPHIDAEQVAAHVTGGLAPAERSAVDTHAADCPPCAAALAAAHADDERLRSATAAVRPSAGLEDRIVGRLRTATAPAMPVPARRAALATAAAAAVIGMGWLGTGFVTTTAGPKVASNVQQMGLAVLLSHSSAAQKWDFGGGSNTTQRWANWPRRDSSHGFALGRKALVLGDTAQPTRGPYFMGGKVAMTGRYDVSDPVLLPAVNGDESPPKAPAAPPPPPTAMAFQPDSFGLATGAGKPSQATGGRLGFVPFYALKPFEADSTVVPSQGFDDGRAKQEATRAAKPIASSPTGALDWVSAMGNAAVPGSTAGAPGAVPAGRAGATDTSRTSGKREPITESTLEAHQQPQAGEALGVQKQYPQLSTAADADGDGAAGRPANGVNSVGAGVAPSATTGETLGSVGNDVALGATTHPATAPAAGAATATVPRPAIDGRKVIRTGVMAFEVEHFDTAADTVAKVVAEAGGFVGTVDSQKMPNGKMTGTITVRVPPGRLDLLVLSLRSLGDLKSQQIAAQDVTKEYTDIEAELTADRAMAERLLDLIHSGKGAIKDLLAAEAELGKWRVKIEHAEGQIRYFNSQIGLSTLAITLSERDLQQAAAIVETETADMGVEADDVERARDAAIKAIDDAKGRVVEGELKRLDAGQLAARIVADVPPEMAGATIDRLKQLGRVARLEVHRQQTATDAGDTTLAAPRRTERRPTRLVLSIYNLANVAPRRTTALTLAADDADAAYAALLALANPGGRVVTSNLDRSGTATGTVALEVPPARLEAAVAAIHSLGEVVKRIATENADTQNTTDAKVGLTVSLVSMSTVVPRQTVQQTVAAADVPTAYRAVAAAAGAAHAHVRTAELNEQDRQNVSATLELDVPRAALAEFDRAVTAAGDTVARSSAQSADTDNTIDTAVRVRLTFASADHLPPRETTTLAVEVTDADKSAADAQAIAASAGGRVVSADVNRSPAGAATAKVVLDVPLARSADVLRDLRQLGAVRGVDAAHDAQAPAGPLAHVRVEVDLATTDALVADEGGPFSRVRHGLSLGLAGLLWSLQLIVVGLCLLVPWALVGYAVRRAWRWRAARAVPAR